MICGRPVAVGVLVALVSWAGCLDEPVPVAVAWEVRNEGDGAIAYTILLDDGRREQRENGTLPPGGVDRHEMAVHGVDLMATAMLRNEPRESAGTPFAIDGLCTGYLVIAIWDGQTWAVDLAARTCQ